MPTLSDSSKSTREESALAHRLQEHASAVSRRLSIPTELRSLVEAEDVMQEAFVDAFLARREAPAGDGQFRAWLLTLARNNLRDALRIQRALKRGGGAGERARLSGVATPAMTGETPSRGPRRAEQAALLRGACGRLPEPYRSAAEGLMAGEPPARIAEHLGRSVGCTYVVLGRTRALLAQALRHRRSEILSEP